MTLEKIGEVTGFLSSYFLFTTILFFVLKLTNKLPQTWNYLHISYITLTIILTGFFIKKRFYGKN
jgi:hypothetical protein